MSAYADEARVITVLRDADPAEIHALNVAVSGEMDTYLHRPDGLAGSTATRLFDAPLGAWLWLPDLAAATTILRNGVNVTADVRLRADPGLSGPPWQWAIYAPAGVPTGWATGLATGFDMISIAGTWGYPTVPPAVVLSAVELVVDEANAQKTMYAAEGGTASYATGTLVTNMGAWPVRSTRRLARYIAQPPGVVRGP